MRVEDMSSSQLVNNLLKKSMDASSYRGRVISNNIANYNTPGYKRHYVTFEETLKDNLNNINMKVTAEKYGDHRDLHLDRSSAASDVYKRQCRY